MNDSHFLFVRKGPNNFQNNFDTINIEREFLNEIEENDNAKKAGVKQIRIHDFSHLCAS